MKILKAAAIALALLGGTLMSAGASAAVICNGCSFTGDTFLGVHDPAAADQSTFTHNAIPEGAINDWWVFDINPAGAASVNAIFNPSSAVSNFVVTLYEVTGATCGVSGTSCTGLTTGGVIATGNVGFASDIGFVGLDAGTYAFNVTGTATASTSARNYSGNLNTFVRQVPEPATLALVAFGLFALGGSLRARRG